METKIQSWGNSKAVRIPSSIIKELNLKENDILKITTYNDQIILEKKYHRTIKERIAEYNGENVDLKEFDFGEIMGREIW